MSNSGGQYQKSDEDMNDSVAHDGLVGRRFEDIHDVFQIVSKLCPTILLVDVVHISPSPMGAGEIP